MGFNSVILVLNDGMAEIDRDPSGFWTKLRQRIGSAGFISRERHDRTVSMNGFMDVATVVSVEHADQTVLIAAGGNMANVIGTFRTGVNGPGSNHHEVDGQAALVQKWAAEHNMALINVDTFHDKVSHGLLNADWNEGLLSSEGATQWADKLLEDLTL